jgi:hypothetical protein
VSDEHKEQDGGLPVGDKSANGLITPNFVAEFTFRANEGMQYWYRAFQLMRFVHMQLPSIVKTVSSVMVIDGSIPP